MLVFKEVHKVIKFNQNASLKLYKYFFKSMNNAVFGKTMKTLEDIEVLNQSQQKEVETIQYQN